MSKIEIDLLRCIRGMRNIAVSGAPDKGGGGEGTRIKLIEEAIGQILKDGKSALHKEYLGYKQYAGFGDQRCDCSYGTGPRHGAIVFSVGRTSDARDKAAELGRDEIYLLECVRDFGSRNIPNEGNGYSRDWNLIDFIKKIEHLRHELTIYESHLCGFVVEEVISN